MRSLAFVLLLLASCATTRSEWHSACRAKCGDRPARTVVREIDGSAVVTCSCGAAQD